ncbi:unnamed protein product [Urochloa humidicola]
MAPPPELIDDAITEILTRLPQDDPACLQRAALVCKPWRRVFSDPNFLRRRRAFHMILQRRQLQKRRSRILLRPHDVPWTAATGSPSSPTPMDWERSDGASTSSCGIPWTADGRGCAAPVSRSWPGPPRCSAPPPPPPASSLSS